MRQVADAVRPDLAIFVMDGSIGQAAFDQAKAFKESVEVGAVVVTKLDGHAKGGGALSAVAATKSPVIFYGTGAQGKRGEAEGCGCCCRCCLLLLSAAAVCCCCLLLLSCRRRCFTTCTQHTQPCTQHQPYTPTPTNPLHQPNPTPSSGEHIDQFEVFETRRFVSRLLGRGDVGGLMDKIQDVIPEDKQPELIDTISRGNVTMRVMRDVFESFLNMGPISQVKGGARFGAVWAAVCGGGVCAALCSLRRCSVCLLRRARRLTAPLPLPLALFTPTPQHDMRQHHHKPPTQIMGMIPGFNPDMFGMGAGGDRAGQLQIKRYITIIESMTEKELDTTNVKLLQEPSRIMRLAMGSGALLTYIHITGSGRLHAACPPCLI